MESDGVSISNSAEFTSSTANVNPNDFWISRDASSCAQGFQGSQGKDILTRTCYPTISLTNQAYESWLSRRMTFVDWPAISSGQHADELASAGFFYTRNKDYVKCTTCYLKIGDWKYSDCPFFEHIRHNPKCSFMKKREKTYVDLLKQDFAWEKIPSLCLACKLQRKDTVFMPCRHTAVCHMCAKVTKSCPICNASVSNALFVKNE